MDSPEMDYETLIRETRRLRGLMWHISNELWSGNADELTLQGLRTHNKQYYLQLTSLESAHNFVARTFDIFESPVDIALQRFRDEYPEPPAQEICLHPERALRKRVFSNNSVHAVEQCSTCGTMVKAVKITAAMNLEKIDFFDQSIQESWLKVNERRNHWLGEKYKVFEAARYAGGDKPSVFDHDSFLDAYDLENPPPITPERCIHPNVEARYRKYSTTDGVVQQCTHCGKHLRAIKKSDFPNVADLPKFDEALSKTLHERYFEWMRARSAAYETARQVFRNESWVRYVTGELIVADNSLFATYYNSPEWANTRERIFKRDDYICRNSTCGNKAECVHHITYERLGVENDFDLIALCHACHEKVHAVQRGIPYAYKLTPLEIAHLEETLEELDEEDLYDVN